MTTPEQMDRVAGHSIKEDSFSYALAQNCKFFFVKYVLHRFFRIFSKMYAPLFITVIHILILRYCIAVYVRQRPFTVCMRSRPGQQARRAVSCTQFRSMSVSPPATHCRSCERPSRSLRRSSSSSRRKQPTPSARDSCLF